MLTLFYLFLFLLGLALGSFIAAWVWRAHSEMSIWFGRSHCVACQYTLSSRDLVPVLSFLVLKGKCRKCEIPLSKHYIFTELFTGIIFFLLALFYQATFFSVSIEFIFSLFVSLFFIAIFVSDLLYQEIPFGMTILPMCILGLFAFGTGLMDWKDMAQGAIIASGFFSLQYVVSQGKWIGLADIAVGALMGIVLGLQKTLVALALSYMLGAVVSVILLVIKKGGRKTALPLGTFLSFATLVALVYGEKIIAWYLKFV